MEKVVSEIVNSIKNGGEACVYNKSQSRNDYVLDLMKDESDRIVMVGWKYPVTYKSEKTLEIFININDVEVLLRVDLIGKSCADFAAWRILE